MFLGTGPSLRQAWVRQCAGAARGGRSGRVLGGRDSEAPPLSGKAGAVHTSGAGAWTCCVEPSCAARSGYTAGSVCPLDLGPARPEARRRSLTQAGGKPSDTGALRHEMALWRYREDGGGGGRRGSLRGAGGPPPRAGGNAGEGHEPHQGWGRPGSGESPAGAQQLPASGQGMPPWGF